MHAHFCSRLAVQFPESIKLMLAGGLRLFFIDKSGSHTRKESSSTDFHNCSLTGERYHVPWKVIRCKREITLLFFFSFFFFLKRQNLDTFFFFPQGILPLLGNIAVIKHNPD